MVSLLLDWIVS